MFALNSTLNRIHEWGEPAQHPMKRLALTRLGCVVCEAVEIGALALACLDVGLNIASEASRLASKAIHIIKAKHPSFSYFPPSSESRPLKRSLLIVCKLIVGLASTFLVGIFFSPELNFRAHIRLELAVNNLTVRKQKELKAKLYAEDKAAEIAQLRAIRIAQSQAERHAAKEMAEQENIIDERLAELLVPSQS